MTEDNLLDAALDALKHGSGTHEEKTHGNWTHPGFGMGGKKPKAKPAAKPKPKASSKPKPKPKPKPKAAAKPPVSGRAVGRVGVSGSAENNMDLANSYSRIYDETLEAIENGEVDIDVEYGFDGASAVTKHNVVSEIAGEMYIGGAYKDPFEGYEEVNEAIGLWAETSNDSSKGALSLQEAASEELGIPLSDWQKRNLGRAENLNLGSHDLGSPFDYDRVKERAFVRTMYETTQKHLTEDLGFKPTDTIRLYRGIGPNAVRNAAGTEVGGSDILDEVVGYKGNSMESWAFERNNAEYFAAENMGAVVAMDVPVSNIISTYMTGYGCLLETEVVIMGSLPGQQAVFAGVLDPTRSDDFIWSDAYKMTTQDRLLEVARAALKHGSGHDEKAHGNWATAGAKTPGATTKTVGKYTFEVKEVKGSRPGHVPSHISDEWTIFNAYRPLVGTLKPAGGGTQWEWKGGGGYGAHFAAVDPADSMADMWYKSNKENQAVILEYGS